MKNNLTKAQTLFLIQKNLKKQKIQNIKIPSFIYFSKFEFLKSKKKIISEIQEKFKKKIIIRSSSLSEDTKNNE